MGLQNWTHPNACDCYSPAPAPRVMSASASSIDGVDGLLNQMKMAVLERSLETEMTHELGL